MAKQVITTQTSKKTSATIKPKPIAGTSKTNGSKRCPTCGKFMK